MARVKSKRFTGVYLNKLANGDVSYSITYKDEAGKVQRISMGKKSEGITETFSHNKRNEIIAKLRHGEVPEPVAKKRKKKIVTFGEVARLHYEAKALHNSNNDKSRRRCEMHILPLIGNKGITSITPDDIEKLQRQKAKELAPKTVNIVINEAATIFNWAIEKGMAATNPAKKVKRLKADNERDRFLSTDDVKSLLREIEGNEQLTLFTRLALSTGGRLHALCELRKKDVNLQDGIITLKDEKSGDTYRAFINSDELRDLLAERMKHLRADERLLDYHTPGVKQIDRQISNNLLPILDRLFNSGIPKHDRKNRIVIHSMRHTFASHLAINGTPIFTIQKLMNHSDIAMTMRYAKLAPDSGKDAVKGLYQ
jgi:integrase